MRAGAKQWQEIAQEDYEVSLLLFEQARHPHALYMMCQAVEKILKAAQIEFAHIAPEKTHQLDTIAHQTGLDFSKKHCEFLAELSKHYRRVRYPDIHRESYNTKAKIEPIFNQGEEVYQWILAKLTSH